MGRTEKLITAYPRKPNFSTPFQKTDWIFSFHNERGIPALGIEIRER